MTCWQVLLYITLLLCAFLSTATALAARQQLLLLFSASSKNPLRVLPSICILYIFNHSIFYLSHFANHARKEVHFEEFSEKVALGLGPLGLLNDQAKPTGRK